MPLANAQFGLLADRHDPGPTNKGVFYVDENGLVTMSDGNAWLPVGGGPPVASGGLLQTYQSGTNFFGPITADGNDHNPILPAFPTIAIPAQTVDMAVTVTVTIPVPRILRAGYINQMYLAEILLITSDTAGTKTFDAETMDVQLNNIPVVGNINPDPTSYHHGLGFQGVSWTYNLTAGTPDNVDVGVAWRLGDDGTEGVYTVISGVSNSQKRIAVSAVPLA